ncbi:hypothetical protein D3C78_755740 [compost metagenome]
MSIVARAFVDDVDHTIVFILHLNSHVLKLQCNLEQSQHLFRSQSTEVTELELVVLNVGPTGRTVLLLSKVLEQLANFWVHRRGVHRFWVEDALLTRQHDLEILVTQCSSRRCELLTELFELHADDVFFQRLVHRSVVQTLNDLADLFTDRLTFNDVRTLVRLQPTREVTEHVDQVIVQSTVDAKTFEYNLVLDLASR